MMVVDWCSTTIQRLSLLCAGRSESRIVRFDKEPFTKDELVEDEELV